MKYVAQLLLACCILEAVPCLGADTKKPDDKDKKSWDVVNPEALKGHDGHHVELKAHVYADKKQIHVMEVKMLKGDSM